MKKESPIAAKMHIESAALVKYLFFFYIGYLFFAYIILQHLTANLSAVQKYAS